MGNPKKPIERQRLAGNPGHRPMAKSSDLAVVVPLHPADVVGRTPLDVLDDVIQHAAPWLGATDVAAMGLLRESLEERVELRALVMENGDAHDRRCLRALDEQIIRQLSALGMDPTARSRLGLSEVKRASKLDEIKARRSAVAQ